MHIINIGGNGKRKTQNVKPKLKIIPPSDTRRDPASYKLSGKNLKLLIPLFCFLVILPGCAKKEAAQGAQDYLKQSREYYQEALGAYKKAIAKGQGLDRLYFELGQLYFSHGDFPQAIEAFGKTNAADAKKFLAISYYRQGDFTAALEIFNKHQTEDPEYLYYQGLTQEKLNLFDPALESYKKIGDNKFGPQAKARREAIEKQAEGRHIKNINPEAWRLLSAAPNQEKFPQAGALILSCEESLEVNEGGTQVMTLHYLVKILNERGKEDFAETAVTYDSTYEKVELIFARTVSPDGMVIEVGTRHIRDVSKYMNFPLYSNARAYIISFPGIAEGAAIEYKVKIHRSQLLNKKDFNLPYSLQASEPIIAASFALSAPKANPPNLKIINEQYNHCGADLKPAAEEKDGYLTWRWQFQNIPQIVPESDMPPEAEINPAMLISTFGDWQEVYGWWWKLAQDKIAPDEAIRSKVKELVKGKKSAEDKARAIYNFCARKIRYVAVEYGQAGYTPHAAGDIFRNKYGDCKDQAILLVTMLKEAGLAAHPVLIATKGSYNLIKDFPAALFDHCIGAVELGGKLVFMDPTAETCSFGDLPGGDQGRRVLVVKDSGYQIEDIPLFPPRHNLLKQELKIKISEDGAITAAKSIHTYGIYAQAERFWLLYTQPELIEAALKEKIQDVSIGARLDKYEIKNLQDLDKPVVLSYSFRGPEYLTLAGRLRIMPQLASVDTAAVARDKRKYDLDFGVLDSKEADLEVEIPENFSVKYLPQSLSADSPWVKFTVEYRQKNSKIYFRQRSEVKKERVSEAEYPEFKCFFEGLAKSVKQRVVLEKIEEHAE